MVQRPGLLELWDMHVGCLQVWEILLLAQVSALLSEGKMHRHVEDPEHRWKSLGLKSSRIGVAAPEELWGTGL